MIKKLAFILTILALLATYLLAPIPSLAQESNPPIPEPHGCTVFTLTKGDQVFFGGNDDYIIFDTHYWVDPGGRQGYGAVWIGDRDNVQQGVNEKGLAYDANGLPPVDLNPHLERKPGPGGHTGYPIQILRECATVAEVVDWVQSHAWPTYMHYQMQFADAGGDAVLISAGTDGELVFTRKPPGDGYLVSTNFNVANPSNGNEYPCWRYEKAEEILNQLVAGEGTLTARQAAGVLDAVHVEGMGGWTLASLLADLPSKKVYLYLWYQFDRPVVLDVAEELANPTTGKPLSHLFPEEVQQEAARRYERIQARAGSCQRLGIAWLALVLASLAGLVALTLYDRARQNRPAGLLLWLPLVALMGPIGLLIRVLAGRQQQAADWRGSLLEAGGDAMPLVAAYIVFMVVVLSVPEAQSGGPLQLALLFGLPLLFEWLLFQGVLLSLGTRTSFLRTLGQRLPQALAAANLGMAGMNAVAAPLVRRSVQTCTIVPLSPWTVCSWWAIAALGAGVGIVLLFLYELWAVRRGFRAWGVVACGGGEPSTPPWRRLWWWVLLSFVALLGGLVLSAVVQ